MTCRNRGPPGFDARIPVTRAGRPAERRVSFDAVSKMILFASFSIVSCHSSFLTRYSHSYLVPRIRQRGNSRIL